jgi:CoA:oxalate CoA-transferase
VSSGTLGDVVVVDFGQVMAGPYCTRLLAELGAQVIKIEPPGGEVVRHRPPLRGGRSRYFGQLNAGKRSVVLDLRRPEGRDAALALVRRADVVVENFKPGVMARLGLDYPACRAVNPSLVYCSISGYGHTGAGQSRAAIAPIIHATSGYDLAVAGYQSGSSEPPATGVFVADVLGGALAMGGILAALHRRTATGEGSHVDIALTDALLSLLVQELQGAQVTGQESAAPPYRPVRVADGHVMVGVVTDRNFLALASVLERPDLVHDPRFAVSTARRANLDELHRIVSAWAARRDGDDVERRMLAAGVPCTRYRSVADQLDDATLWSRGTLRTARDGSGTFTMAASPIHLATSDGAPVSGPDGTFEVHDLGADTEDVLATVAGYGAARIDDLLRLGAAEPAPEPHSDRPGGCPS